jgi:hypothetical protein
MATINHLRTDITTSADRAFTRVEGRQGVGPRRLRGSQGPHCTVLADQYLVRPLLGRLPGEERPHRETDRPAGARARSLAAYWDRCSGERNTHRQTVPVGGAASTPQGAMTTASRNGEMVRVFRWNRRREDESPDEPVEAFWRKRGESAGELVGAAVILVSMALLLVAAVWVVRAWF